MKTERQNDENTTKQGETSKVANLPPGQEIAEVITGQVWDALNLPREMLEPPKDSWSASKVMVRRWMEQYPAREPSWGEVDPTRFQQLIDQARNDSLYE